MLDKMNVAHTEADTHACNVQSRKRRKDRACGRPAARPAHLFFPKGRKQERKPNERRALAREHKGIILATMLAAIVAATCCASESPSVPGVVGVAILKQPRVGSTW